MGEHSIEGSITASTFTDCGGSCALPRRNLTFGMLESLGHAIVTGRFDARPFPTEGELAKQNHVSRAVTREAVKMLTAKGLLSARPRQGTIVQPFSSWNLLDNDVLRWLLDRRASIDMVKHFNQLRVAIEPEAAALAATFRNEEDLMLISAALAQMNAVGGCGNDVPEADIAFHVAVLRASHNPFYRQFGDVIGTALRASIRLASRTEDRITSTVDHADLRDAIVAGDGERARTAMHKLIGYMIGLIDHSGKRSPP